MNLGLGFQIDQEVKWERRGNLKGLHLKITSMPDIPYVMTFKTQKNKSPAFNGGIYIDIFKVIQVKYNQLITKLKK